MTKPNILFLVIDSFRADKCFGDQKTSQTPNLDKLIKNGTYFSEMASCADGTIFSLGGVFTGLYPFLTGLGGKSYNKLNEKTETYFSTFKKNGYHIFGTILKIIEFYNITKDFENKEDLGFDAYDRIKDGLGEKIFEKIDSLKSKEPWVYYIHLLDLHYPIWVPKHLDKDEFGINQYEKMVSAVDEWIGKLVSKINLENTIIIITADHGEYIPFVKKNNQEITFEDIPLQKAQSAIGNLFPDSLLSLKWKLSIFVHKIRTAQKARKLKGFSLNSYEKRSLLNSRTDPDCYLYDELVHIPCIISGYNIKLEKNIDKQVRNIDIFPTLLDIIGFEVPEKRHSRSLKPLISGKKFEEIPTYFESSALIKKSSGDVMGLRTTNYKYFRSYNDPKRKVHLFDLKNDPLEEINIVKQKPEIVKEMEDNITKIHNNEKLFDDDEMSAEETKNVEDELKKLGYI